MIGCSRKYRENHRRKCFGKKEKGIRIKFNHSLAPISFRTTGPRRIRLIIILFCNFIFKGSHRHDACPYFSSKEKLRKIIARTSLFRASILLHVSFWGACTSCYVSLLTFSRSLLQQAWSQNMKLKQRRGRWKREYQSKTQYI